MGGAQHTEQCPGSMPPPTPIAVTLPSPRSRAAAGCTDDAPARRGGSVDVTLDDFFIAPQRIRAQAGPDHVPRRPTAARSGTRCA